MSLVVGAVLGICLYEWVFTNYAFGVIYAVLCGVFASILWPVMGAFAVAICEELNSWADLGESVEWKDTSRLFWAIIWPVALVGSLILFTLLGIIHRVF